MELLVRSDRDGDLALYALEPSGSARRISGLPLGVGPVTVSADGSRLLVDGPRLEVLTASGKRVRVLARSEAVEGTGGAISPHGLRVAYRSGDVLATQSVAGG